jgi:hypothetical protein
MPNTEDIIAEMESTLVIQQGQINILFAIITAEIGKERFKEYIRFIVESDAFPEASKIFARAWSETPYAQI